MDMDVDMDMDMDVDVDMMDMPQRQTTGGYAVGVAWVGWMRVRASRCFYTRWTRAGTGLD